jgi:hypothetical protein
MVGSVNQEFQRKREKEWAYHRHLRVEDVKIPRN